MKSTRLSRTILLFSLACVFTVTAQERAQSGRSARSRLYGDWQLKVAFGERQMDAILSLSRDSGGNLQAQWISPWGMTDLKDVKLEENKLSFVQVSRFRDTEYTSNFTGTFENGKITGIRTSDRGESQVEGQRSPRIPRAVGNWKMSFKVGDRDITTTLVVRSDQEGNLKGEWQSRWGEHEITEIAYERGNLTFKRKSRFQDRQWESTFEGTVRGGALSGTIKSEMGEIAAEGKRIGEALIGIWNLELTSEQWGTRMQRLRVNPDMTGLYGTIPIEKIELRDGRVNFIMVTEFGDQTFEMNFNGKLQESKLSGELKTSRGTSKITGTKVIRPSRRGSRS